MPVFCHQCKKKVENCEHAVPPLGCPPIEVFDPGVGSLAYDRKRRVLEIRYKNGQAWQLSGVPPDVYQELLRQTLSSFLKFIAPRYDPRPVRQKEPVGVPDSEPCPACKRPMTRRHKTSGGTVRALWHCAPCNQSLWRTYEREPVERKRRWR